VLVFQIERPGGGVLVGGDHTETCFAVHGATVDTGWLDEEGRPVLRRGVDVDHSTWMKPHRRASRYLVPEHG
jgi:hypothetical protein